MIQSRDEIITWIKWFGSGEEASMNFDSPGEGIDPCDSWLPGCSGEKASPLSSSNSCVLG